jgi:GH24 family phage-related lysozyme (muramidase)
VYHDGAGNSFVGYGHKVLAGEDFSRGITEAEALALFENDVERLVNVSLDKIQVELTPGHIDSIGGFIFRAGPGAFERDSLPHLNERTSNLRIAPATSSSMPRTAASSSRPRIRRDRVLATPAPAFDRKEWKLTNVAVAKGRS